MTFTLNQAMAANKALRDAAGVPAEQFELPAFIGMLSDEIEMLRRAGKTDEEISSLLEDAGCSVSANDVGKYYAPPSERRRA